MITPSAQRVLDWDFGVFFPGHVALPNFGGETRTFFATTRPPPLRLLPTEKKDFLPSSQDHSYTDSIYPRTEPVRMPLRGVIIRDHALPGSETQKTTQDQDPTIPSR